MVCSTTSATPCNNKKKHIIIHYSDGKLYCWHVHTVFVKKLYKNYISNRHSVAMAGLQTASSLLNSLIK